MTMTPMTIRLARGDDAPAITAIYAPYVSETPISFETAPHPWMRWQAAWRRR
jgi:L-amino acid N-acyltransferase YncA